MISSESPPVESMPPPAKALIESLRGVGFSLATAIADIIDNSIAAGASNVWLRFHWAGADSWIALLDDGRGMDERDLSNAMRFGGSSPLSPRRPEDLGRFGLGLKTASFSQCRRLTVASKKAGNTTVRRWDLDFIASSKIEWPLLSDAFPGSAPRLEGLQPLDQGTLVLWECLDRVVGNARADNVKAQGDFLKAVDRVEQHLAMVYHRFLDTSSPQLRVYINGRDDAARVRPWDPFLTDHPATIRRPLERMIEGQETIEVQGFILPHKDKMKQTEYAIAAGPEGWTSQQGFYVYRNRRLLVAGSWLGLGTGRAWTKEEPYKLARIRLDIPNSADAAWKIDIKKSIARPPHNLRYRLAELAEDVRSIARRVFAHRGNYGRSPAIKNLSRVWRSLESSNRVRYRIDRQHPVVKAVLDLANSESPLIENMLRMIEETVPIQRIWLDSVERGEMQEGQFSGEAPAEVLDAIRAVYQHLRGRVGLDPESAKAQLLAMEPFHLYPQLVNSVSDNIG